MTPEPEILLYDEPCEWYEDRSDGLLCKSHPDISTREHIRQIESRVLEGRRLIQQVFDADIGARSGDMKVVLFTLYKWANVDTRWPSERKRKGKTKPKPWRVQRIEVDKKAMAKAQSEFLDALEAKRKKDGPVKLDMTLVRGPPKFRAKK